MKRLSNRTQDVKLTIKYNPSRPLTQESLNKRIALELATKWGARYSPKSPQVEEFGYFVKGGR